MFHFHLPDNLGTSPHAKHIICLSKSNFCQMLTRLLDYISTRCAVLAQTSFLSGIEKIRLSEVRKTDLCFIS
ncbi:hypothetical protein EBB54_07655 [Schaedlerella arabinosiphila]|uniref:Uncharacterized protein n=1 Tax=Schaedlerella arabinosiphila TaxID=2044587 RepID=A0A3R8JKW2_9FIRM|nr:hypothetical protein EBB54_07655 [Schaedlerella arabinosiphila]